MGRKVKAIARLMRQGSPQSGLPAAEQYGAESVESRNEVTRWNARREGAMKEWIMVLKAADAAARWHVNQRRKCPT
jgi:hypothetical protein